MAQSLHRENTKETLDAKTARSIQDGDRSNHVLSDLVLDEGHNKPRRKFLKFPWKHFFLGNKIIDFGVEITTITRDNATSCSTENVSISVKNLLHWKCYALFVGLMNVL